MSMTTASGFADRSAMELTVSYIANSALHGLRFLMLLAGVAAAGITSVIEYQVVGSLFARELPFATKWFAIAVVLALEIAKIFLIFSFYQQKTLPKNADEVLLRQYKYARWGLVTMSILCMLLWTTYSLSNPEYDAQVSKAAGLLNESLATQKEQLRQSFVQRKQTQLEFDAADVAFWKEKTEFEMNNVVGRTWKGPEYQNNNNNWIAAKRAQSDNQLRLETELNAALIQADAAHEASLTQMRDRLKQSSSSQNAILAGALTTITGTPNYAKIAYTLLAVLLSLAFSAALEYVMLLSFTDLARTYGAVFAAQIEADREIRVAQANARRESAKDAAATARFRQQVLNEKEATLSFFSEIS